MVFSVDTKNILSHDRASYLKFTSGKKICKMVLQYERDCIMVCTVSWCVLYHGVYCIMMCTVCHGVYCIMVCTVS